MNEEVYWKSKINDYQKRLIQKEYVNDLYQKYKNGEKINLSGIYSDINIINDNYENEDINDKKIL